MNLTAIQKITLLGVSRGSNVHGSTITEVIANRDFHARDFNHRQNQLGSSSGSCAMTLRALKSLGLVHDELFGKTRHYILTAKGWEVANGLLKQIGGVA
jgi:hypothetical protein